MISGGGGILPEKLWSNLEVGTCWAYLPRSECVRGGQQDEAEWSVTVMGGDASIWRD